MIFKVDYILLAGKTRLSGPKPLVYLRVEKNQMASHSHGGLQKNLQRIELTVNSSTMIMEPSAKASLETWYNQLVMGRPGKVQDVRPQTSPSLHKSSVLGFSHGKAL
jgi:hypothetical protein